MERYWFGPDMYIQQLVMQSKGQMLTGFHIEVEFVFGHRLIQYKNFIQIVFVTQPHIY